MKKLNWSVFGIIATIAGAGISVISAIADDKKAEKMIEEKVNEALSNRKEES